MSDYAESWLFQINKSRKKRSNDIPDTFYTRVELESGDKP
jgi:hypothetical protein